MNKKTNNKLSNLNPENIKEVNMYLANIFDTNLRSKKERIDGFKLATKLKRNFK